MNLVTVITLLFSAVLLRGTRALDNGLALTPPMGWMAWERFRCLTDCRTYPDECIREELFRTMADIMVSDGYLEAGYEYVMIDDCWASKERDGNGRLVADPERFPSGIKNLSDYMHSKGLKLGIYGDYGTYTCAGYPGSIDSLGTDAITFAEWEVDYLKLDACYANESQLENGYITMGKILNATGRPIVFSCSWPAYQEPDNIHSNYSALTETCNLWRNWDDIEDSWRSVTSILKWFSSNQDRIAKFAGPGHWNDPDMLIIGNFGLSYEQSRAQMAIWAIMAAPLLMSVDLRTIRPEFKDILLNKDVIAINQDKEGIQGLLVKTVSKIDIWTRPINPEVNGCRSYAVAFLSNREDGYIYKVQNVTLEDVGLSCSSGYNVTDVFESTKEYSILTSTDEFDVRVPPSGVVLFKAVPLSEENVV